ncbi:uncharacterized protein [Gossypium hirsutum]|uniref:Gag-pro-like protein n=1 Tax=Gossypium hirsutum TaxID=3635 RepID=A0ABM2Z5W2_GOSHI|nr:uncharacterized protein LOC121210068 [Gossypium hirsutum]
MGIVKFDDTSSTENPLPNHGDKGINAIIESSGKEIKMNIAEVNTPLKEVWKKMVERGLITQNSEVRPREAKNYCEFHDQEGHEIQECSQFRALVQGLMDNKELEFFEYIGSLEEADVCASEEMSTKDVYKVNRPVVIISHSKRVPWNYSCNVTFPGEETPINASEEVQDQGFYTRSGRHYTPNTKVEQVKGKLLAIKQKKEKPAGPEPTVNELVTEKEAKEFLKFLKQSEYSVVEQLHKQPVRISVLALLLSFETHHSALMKIPPGGRGSTKALHITTHCKRYTLLGVLIDNGSALNVLPLSTLSRLPVDSSHMKTCQNVVRAFDSTERKTVDTFGGAVPSSLHQKLKLVTEGRLVTINAEEDIIAVITIDAPYLEANDEAIECSFRSLEFLNVTFIIEGNKIPMPRLSETTRMGLRLTIGKEALPGRGLGKYLQGRINTFVSGGVIHSEQKTSGKEILEGMMESLDINATYEEGTGVENLSGIRPYEPGSVLNN